MMLLRFFTVLSLTIGLLFFQPQVNFAQEQKQKQKVKIKPTSPVNVPQQKQKQKAKIKSKSPMAALNSEREIAAQVLVIVNKYRDSIGLGPLEMNATISEGALQHSRNMAKGRVPFGHEGFDERATKLRAKLKPINAWAENVASGMLDAQQVVDLWLNSAGHRKNIEGNYNLTGIGIASDEDGTLYFTQIFMNRKTY